MKSSIRTLILLTAAAALIPATVSGAVIVANTGGVTNAGGQTNPLFLLAAGFLSPTVATSLTSVNATFEAGSGLPSITLSLFDDAAGSPGSLLGAIGTQTVDPQASYTFTPGSSLSLNAATQYWLVASCSNCASGTITNNWITHDPISLSGLPGAAVTTGLFFKNGADAWGSNSTRTPIFQVNGDVAINGNDVPEPSTIGLVFGGLSLAALIRRRHGARS